MARKQQRLTFDVVTLDGTAIGIVWGYTDGEAQAMLEAQADYFLAEAGYEDINSLGLKEVPPSK